MKKSVRLFMMIIIFISVFYVNGVKAEKKCSNWASKGKNVCITKQYNGYKCAWDNAKKGGGRCYQSKNFSNTTKETINQCSDIKSSNNCSNSKINGRECVWKQGACYANDSDGTNETIIAGSRKERSNSEFCAKNDEKCKNKIMKWGKVGASSYAPEDLKCSIISSDLKKFLNSLFWIISIIGILMLLILTAADFAKVIISSEEDSLQKTFKRTIIRIVCIILLLLLPVIIKALIGIVNANSTYEISSDGKTLKIGSDGNPICSIGD